ncbi:MAG: hemerythrin domain-containing protein [Halobacteriales archaeon]|nr:hemerythrin domain-containing protein [Halobacteriales archaeon]
MKRHPALHDLSRDHHTLLLHARRLRGGDPRVDAATARRRFLLYHDAVLAHHLAEEETAVAPFLRDAALRGRLLREHADIRAVAASLAQGDSGVQLELGDLLRRHVRFEEDELFATLQRDLAEAEWADLATRAHAHRSGTRPGSIGPGAGEECFL